MGWDGIQPLHEISKQWIPFRSVPLCIINPNRVFEISYHFYIKLNKEKLEKRKRETLRA
jgi:hypothetical protein